MDSEQNSDDDDENQSSRLDDVLSWLRLSDTENPSSRRQFLGLLLATVTGVFGTIVLRLLGIFTVFSDKEQGMNNGDDTPSNGSPVIDSKQRGPSPFDIYVYQHNGEFEAITSEGESIDSGSDGWAILESGIGQVPDGGSIYIHGEYDSTTSIEIDKSVSLHGPEASINLHESGGTVFRFQGEERYQTTLTSTAETGDNTIQLSDTAEIQKGDMVLLEEEDGDPVLGREQPPGEPHSVLETNDSTVRLEDSIVWRDNYPSGTLVYVINPIEVHCSGFNMESPAKDGSYIGVAAEMCRGSSFKNLRIDKFGNRAILLDACANTRVRDCTVLQSSDIEAADGYGIQIWAGCHDIIVEACVAKECRHPLSVTPGGPRDVASRSITFRDCFVTADGAGALNCHGGAAHDVRFEGCKVHSWGEPGVVTGAQQTNVTGCEFRMNGHNAIYTRNDGQEMVITVTDTDIYEASSAVTLSSDDNYAFEPLWKSVQLDSVRAHACSQFFELLSGGIDRVRELSISGCYWDRVDDEGISVRNRIDGGNIEGNNFGEAPNNSHIRIRDGPDTDVSNLYIGGNRFRKSTGSDTFIRFAHCEQCVVSDNKFEAESNVPIYTAGADSSGNIVKGNTYHAPDPSAEPVDDDGSLVTDTHVYDTDAGEWL